MTDKPKCEDCPWWVHIIYDNIKSKVGTCHYSNRTYQKNKYSFCRHHPAFDEHKASLTSRNSPQAAHTWEALE